jgi:hypothetical protein
MARIANAMTHGNSTIFGGQGDLPGNATEDISKE